jgi:hypothetical protein
MKSMLNNACISALLCGAVVIAIPALAAGGVGAGAAGSSVGTADAVHSPAGAINSNGHANANGTTAINGPITGSKTRMHSGVSTSTGGMTTSVDINTATAGNNAGSVNTAVQTPPHRMTKKAHAHASSATSVGSGANTSPSNTVQ